MPAPDCSTRRDRLWPPMQRSLSPQEGGVQRSAQGTAAGAHARGVSERALDRRRATFNARQVASELMGGDGKATDAKAAARGALGLEGEHGAAHVGLFVHVFPREDTRALWNVTKAQAARGYELAVEHHATGTTLSVRAAAHHGLAAQRLSQESQERSVRIGIDRDGLTPDGEYLSHVRHPSIQSAAG